MGLTVTEWGHNLCSSVESLPTSSLGLQCTSTVPRSLPTSSLELHCTSLSPRVLGRGCSSLEGWRHTVQKGREEAGVWCDPPLEER